MIIVGAKGFAIETLQVVSVDMELKDNEIVFFDNVSDDLPEKLFNRFRILKSIEEAKCFLLNSKDKNFVLGLGKPKNRMKLFQQFIDLGANPLTVVSNSAEIGSFDVKIGKGTNVLSGSKISNNVQVGDGCIIYYNSIITHDCVIGDFVEVSPNVTILGRCNIGNMSSIGAGAIILPDITIGENVIVGAGAVILKDVPDNTTIIGVPGKIISRN